MGYPAIFAEIICSYLDGIVGEYCMYYCHGAVNAYFKEGAICSKWNEEWRELRVLLCGQLSGRTSLSWRYVTGQWIDEYDPTTDDIYRKRVVVEGMGTVLFDIDENKGEHDFSSWQVMLWSESDVLVLCFAINRKDALDQCVDDMDRFIQVNEIKEDCSEKGVVLVGCQMDRMYDADTKSQDDLTVMEENHRRAMELSNLWNVPFIETSAKRNINVISLFQQIVYEYWLQTHTKSINWAHSPYFET